MRVPCKSMDGLKSLHDSLDGHLRTVITAAGILTAYTYGVSYLAVSDYYANFGLTPEDAGVAQTTLAARAVTLFGMMAAFIAFFLLGVGLVQAVYKGRAHDDWLWRAQYGVGVVLMLISGLLFWAGKSGTGLALILVPVAMGSAMAVFFLDRPSEGPQPGVTPRPRWWYLAVLTAVLAVGIWFAISLDGEAADASGHLKGTGQFQDDDSWNALVRIALGVRAPAVTAPGIQCARLVATNGDRAWLLQRDAESITVTPVERDDLTVVFSKATAECWPKS